MSPHRVGIFGGSFNPPHVAHVLAVVYALAVAPIDEIVVVPVFKHPFSKELESFEDRLAMCELAMGWIPRVRVSSVERDLGGESLTLRTLERLASENPTWSMRLLIGSDVLPDVSKWHRFERIAELAKPFVLERAGANDSEVLLPDVSSTRVRALLRDSRPGAPGDVGDSESSASMRLLARLLPAEVLRYVGEHGLYATAAREPTG